MSENERVNGATIVGEARDVTAARGTCQNCAFSSMHLTGAKDAPLQMICKEASPRIYGNAIAFNEGGQIKVNFFSQSAFPVTSKDEWCGRWKKDPIAKREVMPAANDSKPAAAPVSSIATP